MSTAHIVDLPGHAWEVVNIPSRLTVTSTVSGDGQRLVFEGPPGRYAVHLMRGDEERTEVFTLDDTPQAAPGHIGAEMIKEDLHIHDWGDADYATIKAGKAVCIDPECPDAP